MISIFYRPYYVGNRFHRFLKEESVQRLSSRIRGEEIADYLGAKKNPTDGYKEDTCIFVKPVSIDRVHDGAWLDILDSGLSYQHLLQRPQVKVIAASEHSYDVLKKEIDNVITLIPSHHINQDRIQREKREIKTAGYIGAASVISKKIYKEIADNLQQIGIDMVTCFDFKEKEDAINFYKSIDILVIGGWELGDSNPHKIPTKIINAASFGIPTVAYPLNGYKEIEGYYMRAKNMKDLVSEVIELKNESFYYSFSKIIQENAESYHISKIAELYKNL